MKFKIRPLQVTDIPQIASLHVDTWQRAYKGLLSNEYLGSLNQSECEQVHKKNVETANHQWYMCLAEDMSKNLLGFAKGGPLQKPYEDYDCELYSLYISQRFQQRGVGKALFAEIARFHHQQGFKHLLAWVIARTSAVNFYHNLGATTVTHKYEFLDRSRLVIGVGWRDIPALIKRLES